MSFVCKLSAYHVRVALAEVNRGHQGLWNCSYTQLSYHTAGKLNPGPQEDQVVLLAPKPSLQPLNLFKNKTKPKTTLWSHHKHAMWGDRVCVNVHRGSGRAGSLQLLSSSGDQTQVKLGDKCLDPEPSWWLWNMWRHINPQNEGPLTNYTTPLQYTILSTAEVRGDSSEWWAGIWTYELSILHAQCQTNLKLHWKCAFLLIITFKCRLENAVCFVSLYCC